LEKRSNTRDTRWIFEFLNTLIHLDLWDLDLHLIESIETLGLRSREDVIDFILNGRKEKSIKKAIYEKIANYKKQSRTYSYWVDYALCRTIKDPNLLTRAIKAPFCEPLSMTRVHFIDRSKGDFFYSRHLNRGHLPIPEYYNIAREYYKFDAWTLERFFKFLISKHGEKSFTLFFEQAHLEEYELLMEIMREVSKLFFLVQSSLLDNYLETKLSLGLLHDEFIILNNSYNAVFPTEDDKPLNYSPELKRLEFNEGIFAIKLPEKTSDLYTWLTILNIRAHLYINANDVVYGIFRHGVIRGIIWVASIECELCVMECTGVNDKPLKEEVFRFFKKWYTLKKIIYLQDIIDGKR